MDPSRGRRRIMGGATQCKGWVDITVGDAFINKL